MKLITFIFILSFIFCKLGFSQEEKRLTKPNAILFMLNKSYNKIEAMKKRGMQEEIHLVEEADREINTSIIQDFNLYFRFCPVYYFYADQLELVKKKDWQNVVFYDFEHVTSPKKIEVNSIGNYVIVEVNYPPAPIYKELESDQKAIYSNEDAAPENDYANSHDYGLLMYNDQYELVQETFQFTNVSLFRRGSIFKKRDIRFKFVGADKFHRILKNYNW